MNRRGQPGGSARYHRLTKCDDGFVDMQVNTEFPFLFTDEFSYWLGICQQRGMEKSAAPESNIKGAEHCIMTSSA